MSSLSWLAHQSGARPGEEGLGWTLSSQREGGLSTLADWKLSADAPEKETDHFTVETRNIFEATTILCMNRGLLSMF